MTIRSRRFQSRSLERTRHSKDLLGFLASTGTKLGISEESVFDALLDGSDPRFMRTAKPFGVCSSDLSIPYAGLSSGNSISVVYRQGTVLRQDVTNLKVVLSNVRIQGAGELAPPFPVTYSVAVEVADAGVPLRFQFDEANSIRLLPGESIVSDDLQISFPAGTRVMLRTLVLADTIGETWPLAQPLDAAIGEGFSTGTGWFMLANASIPSLSGATTACPSALLTRDFKTPSICILGSSSAQGTGDAVDAPDYELGYLGRMVSRSGYGYSKASVAGDSALQFRTVNAYRLQHLQDIQAEVVIFQLGGNDMTQGRSLSVIQGHLQECWAILRNAGYQIIQTDYTPVTTSGNNWTNSAGQTPVGSTPVRLAINEWLETQQDKFDFLLRVSPFVTAPGDLSRWNFNGAANRFTTDGTHVSQFGHKLIADSLTIKV